MLLQLIRHLLSINQVLFKTLINDDNGLFKNVKVAVPLKYLTNFWRSLKIRLINCKIHLELSWTKNCVMSNILEDTIVKITNTFQ